MNVSVVFRFFTHIFFSITLLPVVGLGAENPVSNAFPIPDRYDFVNDYGDVLRLSKVEPLRQKLQALERHNGTQIIFLSVPSVGAESVEAYAHRVFMKWNIGNNHQGNGVLFLVSEKGSFIETGEGISGALPDVKLARIFREIITPINERNGESDAVIAGMEKMIEIAEGEDTCATFYDYTQPYTPTKPENILIAILVVLGVMYAIVIFYSRAKKDKEMR
ncbi:TPM domain-containing protein [Undibacterium sp. Dicai25W]|uniref:TPM domain-containing protein n=1 Tax=Undibacterium sp. Dicai25W TaxID=3413034 RepID=UPI003BF1138D